MQKILAYIGGSILTIVLLFGGGFLTGRLTANKQPSETGTEYSGQISRIVELTRSYLVERSGELKQREDSISSREARVTEREIRVTERERLHREAEDRAKSDRTDLTELGQILSNITDLSETK